MAIRSDQDYLLQYKNSEQKYDHRLRTLINSGSLPEPISIKRQIMEVLLLFLLSLHTVRTATEGKGKWCYTSQLCAVSNCSEPRQWKQLFAECGKDSQSPINIVTSKVKMDWNLKPFTFEGYEKQTAKWVLENDGHSVKVTLQESAKITDGSLNSKYKATQFHFHWGSHGNWGSSPGSEHSIDGERYAMELHIVHRREDLSSDAEAVKHKDGLAVLGFFIKVGRKNTNYKPLIDQLQYIKAKGKKVQMEPLALKSLIPHEKNLTRYYRYAGSLTTPGCNEAVVWTVFEEPIELGQQQVQAFPTTVFFSTNLSLPMMDNFRPIQPLGNRTVYKSSAGAILPPAKALLVITIAYLMVTLFQ
ncbi:PREDICTED: carbonic anhydrase 4 [Crocodylus porosus]|uniref:carbonic anhydrase 4 n=1 Tax=Crocodylus porosus TaxID=8502 RepID=UPI00093904F7|nr:PREDICTED: carbonic anhydrase 4 [Crocodylus porosus]